MRPPARSAVFFLPANSACKSAARNKKLVPNAPSRRSAVTWKWPLSLIVVPENIILACYQDQSSRHFAPFLNSRNLCPPLHTARPCWGLRGLQSCSFYAFMVRRLFRRGWGVGEGGRSRLLLDLRSNLVRSRGLDCLRNREFSVSQARRKTTIRATNLTW